MRVKTWANRGKVGTDGLTDRQRALWRLLLDRQAKTGRFPPMSEAAKTLGVATAGGMATNIRALVSKGLVVERGPKGSHCRYWAVDPSMGAADGDLEWLLSRAEMDRITSAVRKWLTKDERRRCVGPVAPAKAGRALAGIVDQWMEGRAET